MREKGYSVGVHAGVQRLDEDARLRSQQSEYFMQETTHVRQHTPNMLQPVVNHLVEEAPGLADN